jgi:hypothetical protein
MSVGTGRQKIITALEITVSFLGIHKWELDNRHIYWILAGLQYAVQGISARL